jgi:hypothetical protein
MAKGSKMATSYSIRYCRLKWIKEKILLSPVISDNFEPLHSPFFLL